MCFGDLLILGKESEAKCFVFAMFFNYNRKTRHMSDLFSPGRYPHSYMDTIIGEIYSPFHS